MSQCRNCLRDMTSRECADEEHRAERARYLRQDPNLAPERARGFSRKAVRNLAIDARHRAPGQPDIGKKQCPECGRHLPFDHFWSTKQRRQTVKCGWCLRGRRLGRPTKLAKKAKWRKTLAETNAFWENQARTHQ